jgi:hypothetical protein
MAHELRATSLDFKRESSNVGVSVLAPNLVQLAMQQGRKRWDPVAAELGASPAFFGPVESRNQTRLLFQQLSSPASRARIAATARAVV